MRGDDFGRSCFGKGPRAGSAGACVQNLDHRPRRDEKKVVRQPR